MTNTGLFLYCMNIVTEVWNLSVIHEFLLVAKKMVSWRSMLSCLDYAFIPIVHLVLDFCALSICTFLGFPGILPYGFPCHVGLWSGDITSIVLSCGGILWDIVVPSVHLVSDICDALLEFPAILKYGSSYHFCLWYGDITCIVLACGWILLDIVKI